MALSTAEIGICMIRNYEIFALIDFFCKHVPSHIILEFFEHFSLDVNVEFSQLAEKRMLTLFSQMKFFRCQRLLRYHTQRVAEKFGRLRAAATYVVVGDVQPKTIEGFLRGIAAAKYRISYRVEYYFWTVR